MPANASSSAAAAPPGRRAGAEGLFEQKRSILAQMKGNVVGASRPKVVQQLTLPGKPTGAPKVPKGQVVARLTKAEAARCEEVFVQTIENKMFALKRRKRSRLQERVSVHDGFILPRRGDGADDDECDDEDDGPLVLASGFELNAALQTLGIMVTSDRVPALFEEFASTTNTNGVPLESFLELVRQKKQAALEVRERDDDLFEAFFGLGGRFGGRDFKTGENVAPEDDADGAVPVFRLHDFMKQIGIRFDERAEVTATGDLAGYDYDKSESSSEPDEVEGGDDGLGNRAAIPYQQSPAPALEHAQFVLTERNLFERLRVVVMVIIAAKRIQRLLVPWFLDAAGLAVLPSTKSNPGMTTSRIEFVPAKEWRGRKHGYYFTRGVLGLGYYVIKGVELPSFHDERTARHEHTNANPPLPPDVVRSPLSLGSGVEYLREDTQDVFTDYYETPHTAHASAPAHTRSPDNDVLGGSMAVANMARYRSDKTMRKGGTELSALSPGLPPEQIPQSKSKVPHTPFVRGAVGSKRNGRSAFEGIDNDVASDVGAGGGGAGRGVRGTGGTEWDDDESESDTFDESDDAADGGSEAGAAAAKARLPQLGGGAEEPTPTQGATHLSPLGTGNAQKKTQYMFVTSAIDEDGTTTRRPGSAMSKQHQLPEATAAGEGGAGDGGGHADAGKPPQHRTGSAQSGDGSPRSLTVPDGEGAAGAALLLTPRSSPRRGMAPCSPRARKRSRATPSEASPSHTQGSGTPVIGFASTKESFLAKATAGGGPFGIVRGVRRRRGSQGSSDDEDENGGARGGGLAAHSPRGRGGRGVRFASRRTTNVSHAVDETVVSEGSDSAESDPKRALAPTAEAKDDTSSLVHVTAVPRKQHSVLSPTDTAIDTPLDDVDEHAAGEDSTDSDLTHEDDGMASRQMTLTALKTIKGVLCKLGGRFVMYSEDPRESSMFNDDKREALEGPLRSDEKLTTAMITCLRNRSTLGGDETGAPPHLLPLPDVDGLAAANCTVFSPLRDDVYREFEKVRSDRQHKREGERNAFKGWSGARFSLPNAVSHESLGDSHDAYGFGRSGTSSEHSPMTMAPHDSSLRTPGVAKPAKHTHILGAMGGASRAYADDMAMQSDRRVSECLREIVFSFIAQRKAEQMAAVWRRDLYTWHEEEPDQERIRERLQEHSWLAWRQMADLLDHNDSDQFSRTYSERLDELVDQLSQDPENCYERNHDPEVGKRLGRLAQEIGLRTGEEDEEEVEEAEIERISELSDIAIAERQITFEEFCKFFDRYRVYKGHTHIAAFRLPARKPKGKRGEEYRQVSLGQKLGMYAQGKDSHAVYLPFAVHRTPQETTAARMGLSPAARRRSNIPGAFSGVGSRPSSAGVPLGRHSSRPSSRASRHSSVASIDDSQPSVLVTLGGGLVRPWKGVPYTQTPRRVHDTIVKGTFRHIPFDWDKVADDMKKLDRGQQGFDDSETTLLRNVLRSYSLAEYLHPSGEVEDASGSSGSQTPEIHYQSPPIDGEAAPCAVGDLADSDGDRRASTIAPSDTTHSQVADTSATPDGAPGPLGGGGVIHDSRPGSGGTAPTQLGSLGRPDSANTAATAVRALTVQLDLPERPAPRLTVGDDDEDAPSPAESETGSMRTDHRERERERARRRSSMASSRLESPRSVFGARLSVAGDPLDTRGGGGGRGGDRKISIMSQTLMQAVETRRRISRMLVTDNLPLNTPTPAVAAAELKRTLPRALQPYADLVLSKRLLHEASANEPPLALQIRRTLQLKIAEHMASGAEEEFEVPAEVNVLIQQLATQQLALAERQKDEQAAARAAALSMSAITTPQSVPSTGPLGPVRDPAAASTIAGGAGMGVALPDAGASGAGHPLEASTRPPTSPATKSGPGQVVSLMRTLQKMGAGASPTASPRTAAMEVSSIDGAMDKLAIYRFRKEGERKEARRRRGAVPRPPPRTSRPTVARMHQTRVQEHRAARTERDLSAKRAKVSAIREADRAAGSARQRQVFDNHVARMEATQHGRSCTCCAWRHQPGHPQDAVDAYIILSPRGVGRGQRWQQRIEDIDDASTPRTRSIAPSPALSALPDGGTLPPATVDSSATPRLLDHLNANTATLDAGAGAGGALLSASMSIPRPGPHAPPGGVSATAPQPPLASHHVPRAPAIPRALDASLVGGALAALGGAHGDTERGDAGGAGAPAFMTPNSRPKRLAGGARVRVADGATVVDSDAPGQSENDAVGSGRFGFNGDGVGEADAAAAAASAAAAAGVGSSAPLVLPLLRPQRPGDIVPDAAPQPHYAAPLCRQVRTQSFVSFTSTPLHAHTPFTNSPPAEQLMLDAGAGGRAPAAPLPATFEARNRTDSATMPLESYAKYTVAKPPPTGKASKQRAFKKLYEGTGRVPKFPRSYA